MAVVQETKIRFGKREFTQKKALDLETSTPLDKARLLDTRTVAAVRASDTVDIFDKNSLFAVSSGKNNWMEWVNRLQKEEINDANLKRSYLGGRVEKSIRWEPSETDAEEDYGETCPIRSSQEYTENPLSSVTLGMLFKAKWVLVDFRDEALGRLPESIRPKKFQSHESIRRSMIARALPRVSAEEIKQRGSGGKSS